MKIIKLKQRACKNCKFVLGTDKGYICAFNGTDHRFTKKRHLCKQWKASPPLVKEPAVNTLKDW